MNTEHCQNCGAAIGKLEAGRVYKDKVVCRECNGRLLSAGYPSGQKAGAAQAARNLGLTIATVLVLFGGLGTITSLFSGTGYPGFSYDTAGGAMVIELRMIRAAARLIGFLGVFIAGLLIFILLRLVRAPRVG